MTWLRVSMILAGLPLVIASFYIVFVLYAAFIPNQVSYDPETAVTSDPPVNPPPPILYLDEPNSFSVELILATTSSLIASFGSFMGIWIGWRKDRREGELAALKNRELELKLKELELKLSDSS